MPPTDPRYLAMTDDELIVEFEAIIASRGNKLKTCPCGMVTHATVCPTCGAKLTGDAVLDDVMKRAEAGESVDLSVLDPKLERDKFVPIRPGEAP